MVAIPKTDISFATDRIDAPTKSLQRMLGELARVADARSTMPVLQSVRIRGNTLAATDLNLTLTITTPHKWGGGFSGLLVNAKALATIAKPLSGDTIALSRATASGLRIQSGDADTTLIASTDRDFPRIPVAEDKPIVWHTCDAPVLRDMLQRVLFSTCQDETRFHLNGVFIESLPGCHVRFVTTDGHRLTMVDRVLCDLDEQQVILPSKAAKQIARMLGDGMAMIAIRDHLMFVRHDGWEIATKLIDATFPPYRQVIPTDHAKLATVERKPLIAALKRAQKLSSETRGVKFELASGKLRLTCDHPDLGTTSESLRAESEWLEQGGEIAIGFNPKYIVEALAAIDCTHVTFAFGKELDPVVIRSTEDAVSHRVQESPFVAVVMPMRI